MTSVKIEYVTMIFNTKKQKVVALDNINLKFKGPNIIAIVGPNGSGKTTLIKIISGIIIPTKGRVLINNKSIIKSRCDIMHLMGVLLPDVRGFFWRLSVYDNLRLYATLYNVNNFDDRLGSVINLIDFEKELLYKKFQECSSGERKKVAIIRALIHNPDILVLDEPLLHLDTYTKKKMAGFLTNSNKLIIYTASDERDIIENTNTIVYINKGKIMRIHTLNI